MKLPFQPPSLGGSTAGRRGAPNLLQDQHSVANLGSRSRSHHEQTTTQPILLSFVSNFTISPRSFSPKPNKIEYA